MRKFSLFMVALLMATVSMAQKRLPSAPTDALQSKSTYLDYTAKSASAGRDLTYVHQMSTFYATIDEDWRMYYYIAMPITPQGYLEAELVDWSVPTMLNKQEVGELDGAPLYACFVDANGLAGDPATNTFSDTVVEFSTDDDYMFYDGDLTIGLFKEGDVSTCYGYVKNIASINLDKAESLESAATYSYYEGSNSGTADVTVQKVGERYFIKGLYPQDAEVWLQASGTGNQLVVAADQYVCKSGDDDLFTKTAATLNYDATAKTLTYADGSVLQIGTANGVTATYSNGATTGVNTLKNAAATTVEYFDLKGCKVSDGFRGVAIRKVAAADGRVSVSKVQK